MTMALVLVDVVLRKEGSEEDVFLGTRAIGCGSGELIAANLNYAKKSDVSVATLRSFGELRTREAVERSIEMNNLIFAHPSSSKKVTCLAFGGWMGPGVPGLITTLRAQGYAVLLAVDLCIAETTHDLSVCFQVCRMSGVFVERYFSEAVRKYETLNAKDNVSHGIPGALAIRL